MLHIAAKAPYAQSMGSESTSLMQEDPSLLHRICCCACRIIPRNQNESQNSSSESTQASFLQRLIDFNVYSAYPCGIDYGTTALWHADFMQVPTVRPQRQYSYVLAGTSETGG